MRGLSLIGLLVMIHFVYAEDKKSLKDFNKAVNKNISEVIEHNPQMYETKSLGRKPASIDTPSKESPAVEKLDEFDEQADTHTSW